MDNEATFQFSEKLKLDYVRRDLIFRKNAKTSRDTLTTRPVWYIQISNDFGAKGLGEIAPLPGLSIESLQDVELFLSERKSKGLTTLDFFDSVKIPSCRMGLEMALAQMNVGRTNTWFPGDFSEGKSSIPINGLVWMNDCQTMLNDAFELVEKGFTCIKFKVGGKDFSDELNMLQEFRRRYSPDEITIRLDANGAFDLKDVFEKLLDLSRFSIHSIEQPVKTNDMFKFSENPDSRVIPFALDEQLIGNFSLEQKVNLLETIRPEYIILKPSLIGGFSSCEEWIKTAEALNIGWWITSMLESNMALKAIAEWTDRFHCSLPQGLGTGSLFTNNIPASLCVQAPVLLSDLTIPNAFNEIFTL
jgi:o-succinylbenzoate synthase